MRILEIYYKFWSEVNLSRVSQSYKIEVLWIVEAGCHDASDTVELNFKYNPEHYFAFEPDPVAFLKAREILDSKSLMSINLFQEGLGNENSTKFLNYLASGKGSGSTFVAEQGEEKVSICRLDDKLPTNLKEGGLLWLDVEGHTVKALAGMTATLKKINIAKVEVQLHSRNDNFEQDYAEVLTIFRQSGMVPVYGPLHPGYFGDIIFIRTSFLGLRGQLRSRLLSAQMQILHSFVYPVMGKPTPPA